MNKLDKYTVNKTFTRKQINDLSKESVIKILNKNKTGMNIYNNIINVWGDVSSFLDFYVDGANLIGIEYKDKYLSIKEYVTRTMTNYDN